MARNIDWTSLDEDDLAYIADRPWLQQEARLLGVELVVSEATETVDIESYADLTVAQLKEELKERELSTDGNKSELVKRLEEDDAEDDEDENED